MNNTRADQNLWLSSKLQKAFSFEDYLYQIEHLISKQKSEHSQPKNKYLNYTALNLQRMRRWLKVLDATSFKFSFVVKKPLILLTLTESWCGDAAHIIPILYILSQQNGLELKLLYRDEHPDLMDAYLTNGSRSIPKVIVLDMEFNELGSWGPRPSEAQKLFNHLKNTTNDIDTIFQELQLWYNKDKGRSTFYELQEVLRPICR